MNPTAITNKINTIAAKYGPFETRTVYKRTVSEAGGNSLIDRGVTQTVVDVAFVPQPLFKTAPIAPSASPPPSSNRYAMLAGSTIVTPGDYEFLFTPTQMTTLDISSKFNIIVLKDDNGNEEQLQLVNYLPLVLKGVEIGTSAVYRSVSRTTVPGFGRSVPYGFGLYGG